MLHLKGITWDHPRGYDPLQVTASAYAALHPEVEIAWEKRSLQAFADFPIEELAREFDLIVFDHPHMGIIARQGCFVPLDEVGRSRELALLADQTVGSSHASYEFDRHQWGLAIDAAAQVAVYRPDLIPRPPTRWPEVLALAKAGKVLWPLKPVDALMSFFTLAANLGSPCASGKERLIGREEGRAVLATLHQMAQYLPDECFGMNPIQVLEQLSRHDSHLYCPLLFGYANYARAEFRPRRLKFIDIPAVGDGGPRGSVLGGAGIGVSSVSHAIDVALNYAFWIAGADCQKGLYFDSGGQPGNAEVWADDQVNRASGNFFRDTRETLERSWLRPRYPGYMTFQIEASSVMHGFLTGKLQDAEALDRLEMAYHKSRAH